MGVSSMLGNMAENPYAPPPAREHAWPDPFSVGRSLRRTMRPTAASAFGPKEENPFRTGVDPAAAESAASVFRAIRIRHLENSMLLIWDTPTQPATTWIESALEDLEEIDREVIEDGLPAISTRTKGEAARILRELAGRTIQPTIYPTDDGEIVIHFQSPGVPAAVLIELSNDGQGAWFSSIGGRNRRLRSDDSSDLPDAVVMAQLEALAAEAGA